jgi:hypothetical protein
MQSASLFWETMNVTKKAEVPDEGGAENHRPGIRPSRSLMQLHTTPRSQSGWKGREEQIRFNGGVIR